MIFDLDFEGYLHIFLFFEKKIVYNLKNGY